jgi:class 3 adenylate cyclase
MFADLVGSTALSAQLDPEDLRDLLATYHRMVSEVVKAHGGHVAQYLGDGALIYFGYPMSHEDDGERALKTGLSLLERTRGLPTHGAEIRIRVGLATGLVVVGDKAVGSDAAHEPRIMARRQISRLVCRALQDPERLSSQRVRDCSSVRFSRTRV